MVDGWRTAAASLGIPDPYLCGVFSPGSTLPYEGFVSAGFDAVTEFYPTGRRPLRGGMNSGVGRAAVEAYRAVRPKLQGFRPQRARPIVHDYRTLVANAMAAQPAGERVFPCVMPSWDNSARRGVNATVIQNDDPAPYAAWLQHAVDRVTHRAVDERIVFINAWNEWAEGCHLEPDLRCGHRFLEATRDVLSGVGAAEAAGRGAAIGI